MLLHKKRMFVGLARVYHSATARFVLPSDPGGRRGGRLKEIIRSSPSYKGHPRRDAVLIWANGSLSGIKGFHIARIRLIFSFQAKDVWYPSALVQWYRQTSDVPDADTGLWVVEPGLREGKPHYSVVSIESVYRAAHLLPVYGRELMKRWQHHTQTLDSFKCYYINSFVDHHAHEVFYDPTDTEHRPAATA